MTSRPAKWKRRPAAWPAAPRACALIFLLATLLLAQAPAATTPITTIARNGNQLLSVTIGGTVYPQEQLAGGTITAFAGASASVILAPNDSGAPSGPTRPGLLADWLLDSGVINPAVGPSAVTVTFAQPIVNRPGADVVFLEINPGTVADAIQVTINGTTVVVPGSAWGNTGYTAASADLYTTSGGTPANLGALQNATLTLSDGNITQAVWGVALDLSDFGVAADASITSLSFGSSGVTFDPVFVGGISGSPITTGGPIISEFLANNGDGLEDEDGDREDWIELYNGQAVAADLTGWRLTDNAATPAMWVFPPGTTLAPFEYRVIYASAKNRAAPLLHTNFRLAKEGGYLALSRPDATIASAFTYATQSEDVSFGFQGAAVTYGFLAAPSPAAPNSGLHAPNGPAEPVAFTHASGVITGPVVLDLIAPAAAGAIVRFTTDLTEPTESSPAWSGPLNISASATVRARIFTPGHLPGDIANRHFILLGSNLAANYRGTGQPFRSSLPVIVLESFGRNVDADTSQTAPFSTTFSAVYEVGASGEASLGNAPSLVKRGGMHTRGQSSVSFPQRQYRWELWKPSQNEDDDAPLLGLPSESDWILHAPWNDKTLLRNALSYELARAWAGDNAGTRTRFVEIFFNQSGATVDFSDYRGVYVLTETIERGNDRIKVEKLNAQMTDPAKITGGYIFSKDKEPRQNPFDTTTTSAWTNQPLDMLEPERPTAAQLDYLRGHMNGFESALAAPNFADPLTGYAAFIEPQSFQDWHLIAEITRQVDAFQNSNYFHKQRGERARALPVWDFNLAWGSTTDDGANGSRQPGQQPSEGWHWIRLFDDWLSQKGPSHYPWFPRLFADPEFVRGYWDRYWEKRRSILSAPSLHARIDNLATQLTAGLAAPVTNGAGTWPASTPSVESPAGRHFSRWQILGTYVWTTPTGFADRTTHASEVNYLKNWITQRLEWFDSVSMASTPTPTLPSIASNVARPPDIAPFGGNVPANAPFAVTNPNPAGGEVLYTINGPDPRNAGGGINAAAQIAPAANVSGTDLAPIGATWKFFASAPPASWKDAAFDDSAWANITSPREAAQSSTTYFRRAFTATGVAGLHAVQFDLLVDDGCVVWLNGVELRRVGVPYPPTAITHATAATALVDKAHESEWITFLAPANVLQEGDNTLAIEVHQYNYAPNPTIPASTDLSFELRARALSATGGTPLSFTNSGVHTIRARVKNGAAWSPLSEATFIVAAQPAAAANLAVTELMYHPADPTPQEIAAGFADQNDFEFIELQNIGASSVDLTGVKLADAVSFNFSAGHPAARFLAPGQRVLVVENAGAFALRYPQADALIAGEYAGNFSNGGETVTVRAVDDSIIAQFTYLDREPWPVDADGSGASMVLARAAADPALPANWLPSATLGGAPGAPDHLPPPQNPLGDDNGNGVSNLLEYATGTAALPTLTREPYTPPGGTPAEYFFLRFRRNLAAGAITVLPEHAATLPQWTTGALTYHSTARQPDGTAIVTYRSTIPAAQFPPAFFARLRVTQ